MHAGDTIVAIASPPGGGARGVVRLSGPQAFDLAAVVAGPLPRLRRAAAATVRLPGDTVLDGRIWTFPAPASYTGDDVVELHVPGSPPLLRLLVDTLVDAGARPAGPGEFTLRAHLAGKLDLVQAEGVQALIMARDRDEARAALARLRGDLSGPLAGIENALLDLCADVEASLDFVEEDIRILPDEEAARRAASIGSRLREIVAASHVVEEGRPTALLWGVPNVGKSALFNRLTGRDAIVSDVAGTTRDILEGEVDGVRLLDAPGPQEAAGLDGEAAARAVRAAAEADLLVLVVDATRPNDLPPPADRPALRVVNKCDLARLPNELCVSALSGEGIDELRAALGARVRGAGPGARFHVSLRQQGWLRQALDAVERAIAAPAPELRALDLRAAIGAVGAVTGRSVGEEILDRLFSRFCIGK